MKNLENYGVLALDTSEIRETDGGWWVPVIRGLAYLALIAVAYHDATCDGSDHFEGMDNSLGGSRPFE